MSTARKFKDAALKVVDRKFIKVYRRFEKYTMISQRDYVANLKLFDSTSRIPGAIVECGTWKGGMIAGAAKILGSNREYYLFDSFQGLPPVEAIDGESAKKWQKDTESPEYYDNCKASKNDATAAMSLAGIETPHLIEGWFEDTLHTISFPNGIAILRMDADWYKSTYQILNDLFPAVNENGLIIIDDYYTWDGCSKAVHDYLSEHKRPERISSYRGVCYMRKRTHTTEETED